MSGAVACVRRCHLAGLAVSPYAVAPRPHHGVLSAGVVADWIRLCGLWMLDGRTVVLNHPLPPILMSDTSRPDAVIAVVQLHPSAVLRWHHASKAPLVDAEPAQQPSYHAPIVPPRANLREIARYLGIHPIDKVSLGMRHYLCQREGHPPDWYGGHGNDAYRDAN